MIEPLLRGSIRLLGALPLSLRIVIGRSLGGFFSLIPTKERKIASLQLARHLGSGDPRTVAKIFASTGQTVMESFNLAPYLNSPASIVSDDLSIIRRLLDTKRGIVCLTGHVSNWDLLAAFVVQQGVPLTVVGREARKASLHNVLVELRERYGVKTIWRSDAMGVKQLLSCLKRGEVIGALIDQDTRVSSIHVPFLGEAAKTPSSLASLALRQGSAVVSAFMVRTGFRTYRVEIREITERESVESILKAYSHHLEEIIRAYPTQWVWFHKRWRTTPDGVTASSREYLKRLSQTSRRAV